MNCKNIFVIVAMSVLVFISCDEMKMDWSKDPSHGEITEAELPIQLDEAITKYDYLLNYTDFTLGCGVGLDLYLNDLTYHDIAINNFDELTIGYAMKHGPMVNTITGEIEFENVDAFIADAKANGLSTYGHTLVWHSNQNAAYLESLIAPVGNIIIDGEFLNGNIDEWEGWGDNGGREVTGSGQGLNNSGYALKLMTTSDGELGGLQTMYDLGVPLTEGKSYTLMFWAKADVASTEINIQFQTDGTYARDETGRIEITNEWVHIVDTIVPTSGDRTRFIFDHGETTASIYIDDIILIEGLPNPDEPVTTIEKTEEEKTQIIGDYMAEWIEEMVTHYKDDVKAWDVVNEPIKDGSTGAVRDGDESNTDNDYFSWQKYLGKDYAVTAFKLARQFADPNAVLFINDYNLETNVVKLDGLISYVSYIEANGATIDGIGTQMHISADTTPEVLDEIAAMFEKLAVTGKQIKVSELDVRLGTATPTDEQLELQAIVYRFVIDKYKEIIPVSQQYGITIWGISDNEQEHEYWLTDESPNLWDINYERKHAYKGAADGLAGYEVSTDFNGELEY